jgi:NAD(P)-dependent dehydrogenase (short-subunit alcohol dehydrogenase family)
MVWISLQPKGIGMSDSASNDILAPGKVAVVTGAALGIGLAACKRFAGLGMKVVLADLPGPDLEAAQAAVAAAAAGGTDDVLAQATDVADAAQVAALQTAVTDRFGSVGLLMNNAASRTGGGVWAEDADWRTAMDVNFWGVVNGVRAFVPGMIAAGAPAAVVNTGSKQGITNPPGNAAYNVTKAALKSYTESLQHELRNTDGCRVSAHLLIPGWTTTGKREHKSGAWLPDQVIDLLVAGLARGDFYILCPDDEVTSEMDRKRILWGAGDITENRPPLSRWVAAYQDAFARWEP